MLHICHLASIADRLRADFYVSQKVSFRIGYIHSTTTWQQELIYKPN